MLVAAVIFLFLSILVIVKIQYGTVSSVQRRLMTRKEAIEKADKNRAAKDAAVLAAAKAKVGIDSKKLEKAAIKFQKEKAKLEKQADKVRKVEERISKLASMRIEYEKKKLASKIFAEQKKLEALTRQTIVEMNRYNFRTSTKVARF